MADTLGTEQFGSGRAFLVDDTNGSEEVGLLKDVSVSFKGTKKPLKSTRVYAARTAITDRAIEGKVGTARVSGKFLATVLGGTTTTGRNDVLEESLTIGATVSPTNVGTNFGECLKVLDAAGNEMKKVAATPQIGEYTVVTAAGATKGQLGLNASEPTGKLKYTYSYSKATGSKAVISNGPIAAPTTFKFVLNNAYLTPGLELTLYAVTVDSVDVTFKAEDWAEVSFSFSAEPNSAGDVAEMNWD